MKSANIGVDKEDAELIIKELDYVGNGKINYSEFLMATLSFSDELTEEML